MRRVAKPLGIEPPDDSGCISITGTLDDGTEVAIPLAPEHAMHFVNVVQADVLNAMETSADLTQLPALEIVHTRLAHGQQTTQLLVSTRQMGPVVLVFGRSELQELRERIDRVLSMASERERPN